MKKIILLAAAVAGLSMASCKKDYTCRCESKDSSGAVLSESEFTINATESDAKSACSGTGSSGGGITSSCSIK
jgi:hypothetical protein